MLYMKSKCDACGIEHAASERMTTRLSYQSRCPGIRLHFDLCDRCLDELHVFIRTHPKMRSINPDDEDSPCDSDHSEDS